MLFCGTTLLTLVQDAATVEKIVKTVDNGLKSTHLPTKISCLHGMLYLLEGGLSDIVRALLPTMADFILRHLAIVSQ